MGRIGMKGSRKKMVGRKIYEAIKDVSQRMDSWRRWGFGKWPRRMADTESD